MQSYSIETIVRDVRTAIDENTETKAFTDAAGATIDTDTLEMGDIIKSKIPDGINAVRMAAPMYMLEPSETTPAVTWTDADRGTGAVSLPADFMRLTSFRMSDWSRAVTQAISTSSPDYAQQFSEFAGVRGNPARPVAALSADPDGGVLEFFSCDSTDATVSYLRYIKRETAQESGYSIEESVYSIEESVYRAVVLKTAALVMADYSNADMMRLLDTLCGEQLTAAGN